MGLDKNTLQSKISDIDNNINISLKNIEELDKNIEKINLQKNNITDEIKIYKKERKKIVNKIRKIDAKVIEDFIKSKQLAQYYMINDASSSFTFDKRTYPRSGYNANENSKDVIDEETQWTPIFRRGVPVTGGNAIFYYSNYVKQYEDDDVYIGLGFFRTMYDENFISINERNASGISALDGRIRLSEYYIGEVIFWFGINDYREMFDKMMELIKPISDVEYSNITKKIKIANKLCNTISLDDLKEIISEMK